MDDNEFVSSSQQEFSETVGFSGYSDFHTIDWQRDLARDRMRHRYIVKRRQNSIWELVKVNSVFAHKIFIHSLHSYISYSIK
jgi:hypothetical protein